MAEIARGRDVQSRPRRVHKGLLVEKGGEIDICTVVLFVGTMGDLEDTGSVAHCCLDHTVGKIMEILFVGLAIHAACGNTDADVRVSDTGTVGGRQGARLPGEACCEEKRL